MPDLIRDTSLDALVAELNRRSSTLEAGAQDADVESPVAPQTSTTVAATPPLDPPRLHHLQPDSPLFPLLRDMVRRGASDLLLVASEPPVLRIDGRLQRSERPRLEGDGVDELFAPHLSQRLRHQLREHGAADFALACSLEDASATLESGKQGSPERRRFRVNVHRQRGRLAATLRALPPEVPTLDQLHLPPAMAELVKKLRGLVLICGPTGAGKTSTLAALVHEINRSREAHILTIEDPIEYEHANLRAIVEQIEIGIDAGNFAGALRACLRQDPDVILVGEMRDLETIATALTAAETGHLILSTLHTNDVAQAVHRIVDVFPAGQQAQIRHQLALCLNAVVCQQLVPRPGGGRRPAVEMLVANYAVRNHIRKDNLQNIQTELTVGRRHGSQSLEASLAQLVQRGDLHDEEAFLRANHPDELRSLLRGAGPV